ncbi:mycothiol transferase [Amycolatopsis sp. NPDC054798]
MNLDRAQLVDDLELLRATVAWKCSQLTEEQARWPGELMTAAGILWHLAVVENTVHDVVATGQPERWAERLEAGRDAAFSVGLDLPFDELRSAYRDNVELCREALSERSFDDPVGFDGDRLVTVGSVVEHLIGETSRHLELLRGLIGE